VTEDSSKALKQLLDEYDEKRRAAEDRRLQTKTDEDRFFQHFAELRQNVVRPVFESMGAILTGRGHEVRISQEEYGVDANGKATEASISMHIRPAGMENAARERDELPSLSVSTRHYNKTVCLLGANALPLPGDGISRRGDYQLAQLNEALIEREVLKVIAEIVGR
jgi:hypothetical protein